MEQEIDLQWCWIRIVETDTEVKVMLNPKKDGEKHLPLAYMLGSNMLIHTRRKPVRVK